MKKYAIGILLQEYNKLGGIIFAKALAFHTSKHNEDLAESFDANQFLEAMITGKSIPKKGEFDVTQMEEYKQIIEINQAIKLME